jgi:hypothetical protein
VLELHFSPPHREEDEHLAKIRRVIAQTLDTQKRQGNRAGNQTIIDGVGLDVRLERDEAYCAEALDYHLGILYAHVGKPGMAAYHFEMSKTHPASGGNQIFSDFQQDSLELRGHQERAIERGLPSIVLASMPRSASASLTQTLATALDIPIMRASSGQYPNFYLIPRWFDSFFRGGAVLHDHFGAIPLNLEILRKAGVRNIFVRVRDPRAASASAAHLSDRKARINNLAANGDVIAFEAQLIWHCEQTFIPWLMAWIEAAADSTLGLSIHFLTKPSAATEETAREVLSVLSQEHQVLAQYVAIDFPKVAANFVTGDEEGWRKGTSPATQERLWNAIPQNIKDFLQLRQ